ncbi:protein OSB4, chloroplastic-like [Phragmites australis]|uniref:protein OSB4, chloroplastic-like n=1 Tax=Phragmites australis TaxID=29695 RepID=UPI002D78CD73|nr:protein OSB4, chloroplastic-like [Phragmites australis]
MLRFLAGGAATARTPPALRRLLHIGGGGKEPESVAYRMSMLRPPSSVRKKGLVSNSCSLIGRLATPVTLYDSSCDEHPEAYTFLSVSPSSSASSSSSSNFWVTLHLKGELANVSLKHLKHNDLVYVSGFLSSYHRVIPSGERYISYKIYVNELNYVIDQNKKPQVDTDSVNPSSMPSVTENKYIDRLRLWQVFFANPYEWWDNRQSKPYVNCPDFKHKDTREKIWLLPDDPPWVRKQLEVHDLEIADNGHKGYGRPMKNHNWKAQDFNYYDDDEVQDSAEA